MFYFVKLSIKSLNPSNMKRFCCGVQSRLRPYKSNTKGKFQKLI